MLSILSSLAESESRSISENETWGIQKRFMNGTFKIGYPPYGYKNVNGEMIVVEEQAEIVRWIFSEILTGKSSGTIAKELNQRGVGFACNMHVKDKDACSMKSIKEEPVTDPDAGSNAKGREGSHRGPCYLPG